MSGLHASADFQKAVAAIAMSVCSICGKAKNQSHDDRQGLAAQAQRGIRIWQSCRAYCFGDAPCENS